MNIVNVYMSVWRTPDCSLMEFSGVNGCFLSNQETIWVRVTRDGVEAVSFRIFVKNSTHIILRYGELSEIIIFCFLSKNLILLNFRIKYVRCSSSRRSIGYLLFPAMKPGLPHWGICYMWGNFCNL